jgi:formylglycine-generating enzyme required for sulfatase activity/transposase-like protein
MSSDTAQGRSDEQKSVLVERILRGEITAEDACREHGLSEADLADWVGAYRRTRRHAMEEQLTAALSARGLPVEAAPISEFSGSLDSLALAELIQTVEYGRKDAQIRVDHDGEQSHIWCEQGQVIDARSGPLVGVAAVYRLLSLRHGRVYARFARVERLRTIHASTAALLLEAARRYDECRELRARIGDSSAVYVVSATAWDAEARLPAETWRMLRAFDGLSSVERVVATRTSPELESLTEILSLLEQGLLAPPPLPRAPRLPALSSGQVTPAESADGPESSFLPLAASLRARLTQPGPLRRRLWLSAAAGAGAVAVAFAIGFWSVRQERGSPAPERSVASAGVARAQDWAAVAGPGTCPQGLARMAGGALFADQPAVPAAGGAVEARIAPFCLARWEVTVAEFEACVAANACDPAEHDGNAPQETLDPATSQPAPVAAAALECNSGRPGRERYPINCVSFQQAQHFCAWRGGRLPSQAEWEYAAAEVTPDPGEAHKGTLPVGSFPAGSNPQGVLDLLGNVSEWTTGHVGQRTAADGEDPSRRQLYAVLGGGLQPGASQLASHVGRIYMNANARGRNVGFRCAFDP